MKTIKLFTISLALLAAAVIYWPSAEAQESTASSKELAAQAAREPKNAKLQQQLGWAYFYEARQGNPEALDHAIQAFERGVELDPSHLATQRGLGLAYFLKTAVLARSKAAPAELKAAFQQTLQSFDRALARNPDDTLLLAAHGSATVIYAGVTRNLDSLKQGMEAMNRAVALQPKAAHGRLFRAFTAINTPPAFRKDEAVIEDFAMLIKHSGSYNEAAEGVLRVMLGDFYYGLKESEKAKAEYAAAAQKGSAVNEARGRLAMLANGGIESAVIQQYRGQVTNCAICHKSQ